MSQMSSEKRFLPNLIALQQFKFVVSGVQDIEYTIGPTLHRWQIWSLERIEIYVASPNLPRIKNWQLECGVLTTKSISLIFKEPIKLPVHRVKH